jgi:hypothetical protein
MKSHLLDCLKQFGVKCLLCVVAVMEIVSAGAILCMTIVVGIPVWIYDTISDLFNPNRFAWQLTKKLKRYLDEADNVELLPIKDVTDLGGSPCLVTPRDGMYFSGDGIDVMLDFLSQHDPNANTIEKDGSEEIHATYGGRPFVITVTRCGHDEPKIEHAIVKCLDTKWRFFYKQKTEQSPDFLLVLTFQKCA